MFIMELKPIWKWLASAIPLALIVLPFFSSAHAPVPGPCHPHAKPRASRSGWILDGDPRGSTGPARATCQRPPSLELGVKVPAFVHFTHRLKYGFDFSWTRGYNRGGYLCDSNSRRVGCRYYTPSARGHTSILPESWLHSSRSWQSSNPPAINENCVLSRAWPRAAQGRPPRRVLAAPQ